MLQIFVKRKYFFLTEFYSFSEKIPRLTKPICDISVVQNVKYCDKLHRKE